MYPELGSGRLQQSFGDDLGGHSLVGFLIVGDVALGEPTPTQEALLGVDFLEFGAIDLADVLDDFVGGLG